MKPAKKSKPSRRKSALVAVVTGGTRGIGLAIARRLAREGYALAICGRDAKALARAGSELKRGGGAILAVPCDVSDAVAVEEMFAAVKRHFGRVDVLVNNAGLSHPTTPVEQLTLADWQRNLDVNLTGTFLCTKSALPLMAKGGTIINNLSVAAKGMFPGASAYNASKWGALGFTNTLREEVRGRGIRVVALLPGPTDTAIWDQFWKDAPREKMVRPESVADLVAAVVALPPEAVVEEIAVGPTGGTL
jgi:NAD(P)-dependent dehydrogenase (short-subunit alcohol dehydrogenase family)